MVVSSLQTERDDKITRQLQFNCAGLIRSYVAETSIYCINTSFRVMQSDKARTNMKQLKTTRRYCE